MTLREFYNYVGGDYDDMISRFGDDAHISRFLHMLPRDDSMTNLTAAVEGGNAQEAFRAVHTLKGISLNLGLSSLANACSVMTEALRGRDVLPERALYEHICKEYATVREALDQIDA